MSKEIIKAGAASEEITPKDSQFLYGYPYVERMSQGAHDPLTCTALFIDNGAEQVMFISHDILYLNKFLLCTADLKEIMVVSQKIPLWRIGHSVSCGA